MSAALDLLELAGVAMVEIAPGSYLVGSVGDVPPYAVKPQSTWFGYPFVHKQQWIPVITPFWISRALITNGQARALVPSAIAADAPAGEPAELGYYRALELGTAIGADLPTWYEWEIAMRGPQPFHYPWGDELDLSKLTLRTFSYALSYSSYSMRALEGDEDQTVVMLESFGEYAMAVSPFGLVDVARPGIEWNRELESYSSLGMARSACDVGAMAFMLPKVRPNAVDTLGDRVKGLHPFSGPISASYGVPVRHELGATLWQTGAFRLVVRS
jgi:formylglycine-generating enzyme required for sulfatase activity